MSNEKGWKELPIGGRILNPGNSKEFKTGDWRSKKPVVDKSKCTGCLLCRLYCPENAIHIDKDSKISIDYDHCKGCGICSSVCPVKAIKMEEEK
ncbi:hypothetical protein DRZ77_03445 [Candidatus Woesearchaeota archaeon]|nr:MAG: hypothetical protein DRZ77_03445 [Candidatus Woesearchaeota archaeon]